MEVRGSAAAVLHPDGARHEMRQEIEEVLRGSSDAVDRISEAGTSVRFIADGVFEPVTLLLDRFPPETADIEHAEITVWLDAERARQFVDGRLVLGTALLEGTVRCRGPIRKYLAVDPVLRHLLAERRQAHAD